MAKSLRSSRALASRTLRRKSLHGPLEILRTQRLAAKLDPETIQHVETDAQRKVRIMAMKNKNKGEEEVKGEEEEMQLDNPQDEQEERMSVDEMPKQSKRKTNQV
jgi:hypothetical protein